MSISPSPCVAAPAWLALSPLLLPCTISSIKSSPGGIPSSTGANPPGYFITFTVFVPWYATQTAKYIDIFRNSGIIFAFCYFAKNIAKSFGLFNPFPIISLSFIA
jgi:hypothetical protein